MPLRGLTPEQLLQVTDAFCPRFSVTIESYSALAGIAAASTANFDGFPVFKSPTTQAETIAEMTERLKPLTGCNSEFSLLLFRLLTQLNDEP